MTSASQQQQRPSESPAPAHRLHLHHQPHETIRNLTGPQRQDIRASQRTFEGAYMRTAFTELGFGLLIVRLFSREFLPIGSVFTAHAILMIGLSLYQRDFLEYVYDHDSAIFTTGGYNVLLAAGLGISAQIALLVLLVRI